MFGRISFDENQIIDTELLKILSDFLCDNVIGIEMYQEPEEDKLTEFCSWRNHTLNPSEVTEENKKKLVIKTDKIKLNDSKEYLTNIKLFLEKFPSIRVKIRGLIQHSAEENMLDFIDKMQEMQDKINKSLKSFNEKIEFNQKCDIHIPNMGMISINQLAFATDKCTQELQSHLNQGWRILAICPQSDQRRPDYVLGRFNPGEDNVDCVNF